MFTPPPSPLPFKPKDAKRRATIDTESVAASARLSPPLASPHDIKRATGRRMRWAVLLVPLVIILITASTRYLVHPVAFDVFSQPPIWDSLVLTAGDWTPHKRHPSPEPQQSGGTSTNSANAPLPTIPTNPDLPTPFPQPFDSDLTQNFSSISCFNFFSNMTNAPAFRSCRPFSMLLQSSANFIDVSNHDFSSIPYNLILYLQAQQNATLLNSILWGTCNTSTDKDQCVANMGWFASTLKTACVKDLEDNNAMSVSTLTCT
jgi:hypothetical protein